MYEEAYIVPKVIFDSLMQKSNINKNENKYINQLNKNTESDNSITSKFDDLKSIDISNRKSEFKDNTNIITKDFILSNISQSKLSIVQSILSFLQNHRNIVSWKNNGELILNNLSIPHSNIFHIIQILVQEIKSSPFHIPPGVFELYYKLKDLGYDITKLPFLPATNTITPENEKSVPNKVQYPVTSKNKVNKVKLAKNKITLKPSFFYTNKLKKKIKKKRLQSKPSYYLDRYSDADQNNLTTNISQVKKDSVKNNVSTKHFMKLRSHQSGDGWQTINEYYNNV